MNQIDLNSSPLRQCTCPDFSVVTATLWIPRRSSHRGSFFYSHTALDRTPHLWTKHVYRYTEQWGLFCAGISFQSCYNDCSHVVLTPLHSLSLKDLCDQEHAEKAVASHSKTQDTEDFSFPWDPSVWEHSREDHVAPTGAQNSLWA